MALNWITDQGSLLSFSYSNRRAAYLDETLTSGGSITALDESTGLVELNLFVKNEQGEVITPGTAQVRLAT